MSAEFSWPAGLEVDIDFGYLGRRTAAPRRYNPKVVLNTDSGSMLRVLREELARATSFTFSVAFVSPRAIALLKQELRDFREAGGHGRIVTSDYLGFNSPRAFDELLNLKTALGIDVRIHQAGAFHPKGYIFNDEHTVTALMGSSNLTEAALVTSHEWNLRVSAAPHSDLGSQITNLQANQLTESLPLDQAWIDDYSARYQAPSWQPSRPASGAPDISTDADQPRDAFVTSPATSDEALIVPNKMQTVALEAIARVRNAGNNRAIVISATGTGKTILSALDVRAFAPRRMLFVVHREQILDRTITEYLRVLGGQATDYGKLSGTSKQTDSKYLFATVQTLSRPEALASFEPDDFDYIVIDEAHRAGAATHLDVINYFRPTFLLGMTATPERTDSFNVFELFDYNVPYEIRLNHALEEDMLSPFHYYGVSDVTYEDGTTTTDESDLQVLISAERVDHLLRALTVYGQAGVAPRGLIFCGRVAEAEALSLELNKRTLRGRPLRTIALSGSDSVEQREAAVQKLEAGHLDYILSVDVFNEGVDIPSINQVIMLRQTKSAIVFVQQLGRGLRKAPGKEYLVVIDFIGNYTNNFLIPIALFGDESLNKESVRRNLIAAEESGVLPGLSSVRFDRVSQQRVLSSISETRLDSMQNLKASMQAMRNRVGGVPDLFDFWRFESTDPVLLATRTDHYLEMVRKTLRHDSSLTPGESKALKLVSHEVFTAKRPHECLLLDALCRQVELGRSEVQALFAEAGITADDLHIDSAIATFTLANHAQKDHGRYGVGIATSTSDGGVRLTDDFVSAYVSNDDFTHYVDDIVRTGIAITTERYTVGDPFVPGRQYGRKEAARLLGWPVLRESTIYGYFVDTDTDTCAIFVTLHKSDDVAASTAYEDELLSPTRMRWFTKNNRTLASAKEALIANNAVALHVFVKKDDAEGSDFYYLGSPTAQGAVETTMDDGQGRRLSVVTMDLVFDAPLDAALFDYFHPEITELT